MANAAPWSRAADASRRVGHAVEFHAEIASTNDRAREALAEPGGAGLAIVADLQTAGRGRRGRTWISPPGVNLMCSVGLKPDLPAADAGLLGIATALAVREACLEWTELRIRWPNDLVADDEAKVAGLLLETSLKAGRIEAAIIGVGINVNWPRSQMPAEIAPYATSLCELTGQSVDRVELLSRLLASLDREMNALEAGHSPVPRYRSTATLAGQQVELDLGDRTVSGRVAGFGEDGALLLEANGRTTAFAHGEVVRVQPVASGVLQ